MELQKALVRLEGEYVTGYSRKTWSQEGEDMVLNRYFDTQATGFYVDVGAHHPKRYSNTWLFYKKGWRGINIDAMPGSMAAFRRSRKRDINIECGVGEAEGYLNYYVYDDSALNSFSKELVASRHLEKPDFRVVETRQIKVDRLENILEINLPLGQEIDFMTIDVEGLDLEVLRSNDWSVYRPTLVLVEILGSSLAGLTDSPVVQYLEGQQYEVYSKCAHTVFFRRAA